MRPYLASAFKRFVTDMRGAVGIMAAGAIPVLAVMVGAAVDYARVEDARVRLQHAADSAALAVAQAQVLNLAATAARADPLIDANFGAVDRARVTVRDIQELGRGYARIALTAEVDMFFLQLVGVDVLEIGAVSEAQFDTARDIEITVLLDNSASMLIGATPEDIEAFEDAYGCAFACHFDIRGFMDATYELALRSGNQTRLDVARDAISRAFEIADESGFADLSTVYFDVKTFAYRLSDVATGEASDLLGVAGAPVRDIGPASPGRGDYAYAATDYEAAFAIEQTMLDKLVEQPDRSHFLLFITDGVADYYRRRGRRGYRYITPFDPALCDSMKAAGVQIGVIYTTYFEIPNESFWRRHVRPFNDQIGPSLAACASPGWFFEAEYAEQIDAALEQLVSLAIPKPQLTQ